MKKILFVLIVLALSLSACSAKDEADKAVVFSQEYEQACFDMKGLMSPNGCVMQVCADNSSVQNPISAPASDCGKRAEEIGAPKEVVSAICDAIPGGKGVSLRLPIGTKVEIGTITFDNENRVWFLQNFTTPLMANYAFEYKGSEQSLFDAPFVVGSELGYGENGERVPFKICYDVVGDCTPPVGLFPTE